MVDTLRLADGALFPMPITLDVSREDIERLNIVPGARLALQDPRDEQSLAIITGKLLSEARFLDVLKIFPVDDVYQPDQVMEAIQVFGADDPAHPRRPRRGGGMHRSRCGARGRARAVWGGGDAGVDRVAPKGTGSAARSDVRPWCCRGAYEESLIEY